MAERRMFSKTVIDSDEFLDMPSTAQLLYFHLAMRADDDGFIDKPKTIMRICGSKDDDMKVLISKQYILPFETGVVVVRHWRVHNYIRSDRYIETRHKNEKGKLSLDENKEYLLSDTVGIPSVNQLVYQVDTQVRLGKDRIEKETLPIGSAKKSAARFTPPTVSEVEEYAHQMGYTMNAHDFWDFYQSKGWMVGKDQMTDWRASARKWARQDADRRDRGVSGGDVSRDRGVSGGDVSRDRGVSGGQYSARRPNRFHNYRQRDTDYDALVAEHDPLINGDWGDGEEQGTGGKHGQDKD